MKDKTKNKISYPLIALGLILFLFGAGADLTIIGAPEGFTVNILGIIIILAGLGRKIF